MVNKGQRVFDADSGRGMVGGSLDEIDIRLKGEIASRLLQTKPRSHTRTRDRSKLCDRHATYLESLVGLVEIDLKLCPECSVLALINRSSSRESDTRKGESSDELCGCCHDTA